MGMVAGKAREANEETFAKIKVSARSIILKAQSAFLEADY